VFLTVMVIGLVGLVMMAVPALGGHHHLAQVRLHGHAPTLGHPVAHAPALGHPVGHAPTLPRTDAPAVPAHLGLRFIPSPRAVFSLLALYGAVGNALVHAAHLPGALAAWIAIGPALLIEWLLIRPIWNLVFRFQGKASTPLEELILAEAQAVVPFRNGRGLVATVRDGRRVQLSARLTGDQTAATVAVGQRLRIEDVDARRECVTVSVLPNAQSTDNPS
jgi:hypothetical protein